MVTQFDRRGFIAGCVLAATAPSKILGQPRPPKVRLLAVGIGKYDSFSPLSNPALDAQLVGEAFRALTYLVPEVSTQVVIDETRDRILEGAAHIRAMSGDGPIVMFFAGHGVQVEGRSYLVPPDCTYWRTPDDVKREGVDVGKLIETYTMATGSSFMLFLDACRVNPFADAAWSKDARGLSAPVTRNRSTNSTDDWVLPDNVAISYSTQPGMTASDGPPGRNSAYAVAFASIVSVNPLVTYRSLTEQLKKRVMQATNGVQVPWYASNLDIERPIILAHIKY
jgi:uncharacterized caspase-like protein